MRDLDIGFVRNVIHSPCCCANERCFCAVEVVDPSRCFLLLDSFDLHL